MLVPKKARKLDVVNPFRPETGIPNTTPTIRLSWYDFEIEQGFVERRIMVDCTPNEDFLGNLMTIPKSEKHWDSTWEVWYIDEKHKAQLKLWAEELYEKVVLKFRTWE
mgnify:CR=1 FL=1